MDPGTDAVQTGILAATVFALVAGFVVLAGRYRDARLLALLAEERRRLELVAERICELVATRDGAAYELAALRLEGALAPIAADLPECRRLLLLERGGALTSQARLALAELADAALEAEIDLDLYTLGFAWARRRRAAVARRVEERGVALAPERRAA